MPLCTVNIQDLLKLIKYWRDVFDLQQAVSDPRILRLVSFLLEFLGTTAINSLYEYSPHFYTI